MMTEGSCNGCGRCCDPVVLGFGPDDVRRNPQVLSADDVRWILNDLTLIGRREGLAKADYLTQGGWTYVTSPLLGAQLIMSYFYRCRRFDAETRSCAIYDNRPRTCREYPWGDEPPDPKHVLPPECGYLVDVGRVPVQMRARR